MMMERKIFELKTMTDEHIMLVHDWRNQPHIREMMFNSEKIPFKNHLKWFESITATQTKQFKILYYQGKAYGMANFTLQSKEDSRGEWGFYIGELITPKGIGTLLGYMMLNFLFEEIHIRKVCAEVIDYNKVSLNFHQKLGFKQDGNLREHIFKNGRYCDVHLFSIFREEWLEKRPYIQAEIERNFL